MSFNLKNGLIGISDDSVEDRLELENKIVNMNKRISELKQENENLLQKIKSLKSQQEYSVQLESKIFQLNKKIEELEERDIKLSELNDKRTVDHEYIDKLENQVMEYNGKIESLEKINKMHRENIDKLRSDQSSKVEEFENKIKEQNEYVASLIKENRDLHKKLEVSKTDENTFSMEENVTKLQKKIAHLDKLNRELEEKNQVLKAALLLHVDVETEELTDTKIKILSEKVLEESIKQKEMIPPSKSTVFPTEKIETRRSEPIAEISKGKVQELINQRHAALESRENINETPTFTQELMPPKVIEQKPKELPSSQKKIIAPMSLENTELPDIDNVGVIETSEGKRKCPICQNENLRLIREIEDKTKIISVYPRLYGKKLKCGQCGAEWR